MRPLPSPVLRRRHPRHHMPPRRRIPPFEVRLVRLLEGEVLVSRVGVHSRRLVAVVPPSGCPPMGSCVRCGESDLPGPLCANTGSDLRGHPHHDRLAWPHQDHLRQRDRCPVHPVPGRDRAHPTAEPIPNAASRPPRMVRNCSAESIRTSTDIPSIASPPARILPGAPGNCGLATSTSPSLVLWSRNQGASLDSRPPLQWMADIPGAGPAGVRHLHSGAGPKTR